LRVRCQQWKIESEKRQDELEHNGWRDSKKPPEERKRRRKEGKEEEGAGRERVGHRSVQ
jgi:hypothetical protein